MKKAVLLLTIVLSSFSIFAQTGVGDDFENASLFSNWDFATNSPQYKGTFTQLYSPGNTQMFVEYTTASNNYLGIVYNFSAIDITDAPFVSLKLRTGVDKTFTMRIDLIDINGKRTNQVDVKQLIKGDNTSKDYLFDFSGKFFQLYPDSISSKPNIPAVPYKVQMNKIARMEIIINPGKASTTGTFILDSVMIGTRAKSDITSGAKGIKLNQLGFFIDGPKKAVISGGIGNKFYIVNQTLTDTVYTGTLSAAKTWIHSGENVRIADFSNFKTIGTYRLRMPGVPTPSYTFIISKTPLNALSKGSIKGFYYQRASMALKPEYAGIWARSTGHPDNQVRIHKSAVSPNRPEGTIISSPRGWYDAGDYNKYIVNSGITTYTLLASYEHFPTYYDTLSLNIPESNNTIPDILDEALYNVRWMLTMQDPGDGGVYHKLTNANFDGDVMPNQANSIRYVVQKTTCATLDFAAVMAQSARIFGQYPTQLPKLADSCLVAAKLAYDWAILNPSILYNQSALTNPSINTGEYGDKFPSDEFNWAAAELFITTRLKKYHDAINFNANADLPGWPNVNTLGFISLAHNKDLLSDSLTTVVKNKIINLSNAYRNEAMTTSAYGIAMGAYSWNFGWGSNSSAANQSIVLIQAFNYTKDSTYLKAATSNVDYLLGRNALNYSFVTGYGSLSSNNPHHRLSQADGVAQAVPGLLVGGPNPQAPSQDQCVGYPSVEPAMSYVDSECSFASNEIAINWNAPLVYITGAIESIYSGIEPIAKDYTIIPTFTRSAVLKDIHVKLYPNPANAVINVEKPFDLISVPTILDLNGIEYPLNSDWSEKIFQINTSQLSEGLYLIRLQGENGTVLQKFMIMK